MSLSLFNRRNPTLADFAGPCQPPLPCSSVSAVNKSVEVH
jgi:hypothetical protein